jgi:hypothetical protein
MSVFCKAALCAICFSLVTSFANGQERVHAVSGTVTSINPKIGMIEINTDDGTSGHFKCVRLQGISIDFDKDVKAETTDADKFTATGAHVIVYFFGDGEVRTAVALRVLGNGPFESDKGTVVKVNRHDHLIIIKTRAGADESFRIDPKTVADTTTGVVEGFKLDFDKGDAVQVTATPAAGDKTALLIAPAA